MSTCSLPHSTAEIYCRGGALKNSVVALEKGLGQRPGRAAFVTVPSMNSYFGDGPNKGCVLFFLGPWVVDAAIYSPDENNATNVERCLYV